MYIRVDQKKWSTGRHSYQLEYDIHGSLHSADGDLGEGQTTAADNSQKNHSHFLKQGNKTINVFSFPPCVCMLCHQNNGETADRWGPADFGGFLI